MHAWILHGEKEGKIYMNINEQTVSRNLNLIREIRDNSLFVYGFDQNMLNMIVCAVSCE